MDVPGGVAAIPGERAGLPLKSGVVVWEYYCTLFPRLEPDQILRLYAGQPDPKDPTHFTFGYSLDGRPGTFDAWLRADGRIAFSPRDGPAVDLWSGSSDPTSQSAGTSK